MQHTNTANMHKLGMSVYALLYTGKVIVTQNHGVVLREAVEGTPPAPKA